MLLCFSCLCFCCLCFSRLCFSRLCFSCAWFIRPCFSRPCFRSAANPSFALGTVIFVASTNASWYSPQVFHTGVTSARSPRADRGSRPHRRRLLPHRRRLPAIQRSPVLAAGAGRQAVQGDGLRGEAQAPRVEQGLAHRTAQRGSGEAAGARNGRVNLWAAASGNRSSLTA